MFEKILVPVDGSPSAKKAALVAKEISEKFGSEVFIINVLPDIAFISQEISVDVLNQYKVSSENILTSMKALFDKNADAVRTMSLTGNVSDDIISFAESEHVSLIVMGSRGLGTFSRALLGSVSDNVIHHSKISVMVVK